MRYTQAFLPTRKEDPADAEMPSHRLLLRAGFMEQVAAGIYNLLPLGWRCCLKIQNIVREEMNRAGAQELLMPFVQPAELWQQSGRWEHYGPELLRIRDRKSQEFCLGPTHEEVITDLVRKHVRSYRDLPLNLYQIQAKFRDEVRPRAGLMRGREFIMKDAYSFDTDLEGAQKSYEAMRDAYNRIFTRCGLRFQQVEADTGNIGGSSSHEFQVLADTGEDRIVSCPECGYTANEEKAEIQHDPALHAASETAPTPATETIDTPGKRTIEEVTAFLGAEPSQLIKTLVFLADDKPIVVLVRGDHEVNEIKVKAALGASQLFLAGEATVQEVTGAPVGYAGPVGISTPIIADHAVSAMTDAITGGNAADTHIRHVLPGRDFTVREYADLRLAQDGDPCPRCGTDIKSYRGIEVGHIFVLGTKYSEPMGATYLNSDGDNLPIVMGCYGIGITRILAAAIEQSHDDNGIIFPTALAPFQVTILPLQMQNDDVVAAGESIYRELTEAGIEVLLDDRDIRAGGKFKDADLVGIPYRIVIGNRGLKKGIVELKRRDADGAEDVALENLVSTLESRIASDLAG